MTDKVVILVDKLRQDKGKHVEVYGVPSLTANSLIKATSKFNPIDEELLLNWHPPTGSRQLLHSSSLYQCWHASHIGNGVYHGARRL